MNLKEGDVVLCKVKRIEKTTVFLDLPSGISGSMVMSEVSAGRIRNLREFVAPNKQIVCKILKISKGHPELSLRRVTAKEREYVLDRAKKEKTFLSILKTSVKNPDSTAKKIQEKTNLADFFDSIREDPKLLESYLSKSEAKKLSELLASKKEKEKEVEKIFTLRSYSPSGIQDIKEILNLKANISYLGSSKFSIKEKAQDFKSANTKLQAHLKKIEDLSKKKKAILTIREK